MAAAANINQCMYAFTYWHAYFDSAFLTHPLRISDALYQDLQITPARLLRWPPLEKLPQLPRLFELLEGFVLEEGNWTGCQCGEGELDTIQTHLNRLILNFQLEKRYGAEFWPRSNRRIQASIVHFSIFIKKLALAVIPEDCRNLMEAHRLQKLTTEMSRLELLMNEILKLARPVHHFLFRKDFEEESELSKAFFQEFMDLIHKLPRVKKSALLRVPKLMEYICVINPTEAEEYVDFHHIRRKNATVFDKPKAQKKHSLEKHCNESSRNFRVVNNSIVKIKEKKTSLEKISFDSPKKRNEFIKNFQIFRFQDNVRKHSFYQQKKKTVASLETKDKTASLDKDRSPSFFDRSLSIHDPVKLKSRTIANDVRMKDSSLAVESRSREMTTKSIISRRSRSIKKIEDVQGEEVEHEREEKTKKKKVVKLPIKTTRYSQQEELIKGKGKGWAIIREYLLRKIVERKLQRLMFT